MAKVKDATLREQAERQAEEGYKAALGRHPSCLIEQVEGRPADPDVKRFWAVQVEAGLYRACILYDWPGRGNAMFVGKDGSKEDLAKWLTASGVPTVKLGKVCRY